jgi:hypothetical protein
VVGGAAAEEMNIVLPDPVVELIVVTEIAVKETVVMEIAITEDLLPPEMATIAHIEEMIPAKRMDYLVAEVVAEELTALPIHISQIFGFLFPLCKFFDFYYN